MSAPSALWLHGLQSRLLAPQLGSNLHVALGRRGQGLGSVDVAAMPFVSVGFSDLSLLSDKGEDCC